MSENSRWTDFRTRPLFPIVLSRITFKSPHRNSILPSLRGCLYFSICSYTGVILCCAVSHTKDRATDCWRCCLFLGVHWIQRSLCVSFTVWADTGNHGNASVCKLERTPPPPSLHHWLAWLHHWLKLSLRKLIQAAVRRDLGTGKVGALL